MIRVLSGGPCQERDAWDGRGSQAAMAEGRHVAKGTEKEKETWKRLAAPMAVVSQA